MQRLTNNNIGISQGSRVLFSDFIDDGPMWTGTGPREHRFEVEFEQAYAEIPNVMASISMWDSDTKTNQRMDIAAENITEAGFDLVFRTWGDSRVARVRANWIAIGPLPNEDDWQLY
ncbi:H-type lectin domain-containing protein [Litoreibacter janthinus]|uniref:H-type lectin domain-containing protein n=1 Tax=Litoreibacter janthinus TaxID=670154 RepID=A0A1I6HV76_9RHOB|nr:H-type lectin domain-containing protein [Litoreibacter janthinus]SFR58351.1 H-type lectin domain-containing protein [Litoreibacter janthinus]